MWSTKQYKSSCTGINAVHYIHIKRRDCRFHWLQYLAYYTMEPDQEPGLWVYAILGLLHTVFTVPLWFSIFSYCQLYRPHSFCLMLSTFLLFMLFTNLWVNKFTGVIGKCWKYNSYQCLHNIQYYINDKWKSIQDEAHTTVKQYHQKKIFDKIYWAHNSVIHQIVYSEQWPQQRGYKCK